MIEWKKKAKKQNLETADRRVWESRCGEYKIEEHKSTVGLPTRYLALAKQEWGWAIISYHRKRATATQALDKYVKKEIKQKKTSKKRKIKRK